MEIDEVSKLIKLVGTVSNFNKSENESLFSNKLIRLTLPALLTKRVLQTKKNANKLTKRIGEMNDQNVNVDVVSEQLEHPQVSGAIDERRDCTDQSGRGQIERYILNQR